MDNIWFLLQPSSSLMLLLFGGILVSWVGWYQIRQRWETAGRVVILVSAVALFLASFTPVGNLLLMPLEDRFPQPLRAGASKHVDGIIVLGGATDLHISRVRGINGINSRGDRLVEAAILARKNVGAKVYVETDVARNIFIKLGVPADHIVKDPRPRNTYDGARYLTETSRRKPGERWLLVTSAYHMPRAIGSFRKAGFDIEAWPVDYRTSGKMPKSLRYYFDNPSEGLYRTDLAAKEWIGLFAYWLAGRTSALYPGPMG